MKKFFSILLCVSLLFTLSAPAFAASPIEKDVNTRIEELNDSVLFTYTDDTLVFCSQIYIDGNVNFSYVERSQNKIFESEVMRLNEVIEGVDINDLSKEVISENITSWSNQMIDDLGEFEVAYSMNCDTTLTTSDLRAATPISTMLNATYGEDYVKRFDGYSRKTYNGEAYTVYCYGFQSTRQLKYAPYEFAAQSLLTTIAAWIATGGFSLTVTWFLSAAGATVSTVGTAQYILYAISGDLYVYQCDRTRIVTVPEYTSATQYWFGWTLKSTFVDNGSTWDVSTYHDIKNPDYDDVPRLMQIGFDNFVAYTLQ